MGMASAVPSTSRRWIWLFRAAALAIPRSFGDGSRPDDLGHCVAVERQIETGADTDLENSTCRVRYNASWREPTLPHGQMYQPREDLGKSPLFCQRCLVPHFYTKNAGDYCGAVFVCNFEFGNCRASVMAPQNWRHFSS